MNEKEINFHDLFFQIMLHWRSMILFILIGGIVSSASTNMHLRLSSADTQDGRSEKAIRSELKKSMTQTELSAVEQALLNGYSCQKWQAYIESSALMALDPSQVYQADLVYAVKAAKDSADPTAIYLDLLATNDMHKFVAKKTDPITLADAHELIHVLDPNPFTQKQENSSFRITIIAGTKKICTTMSTAVQEYIKTLHKLTKNTYGPHDTILLQDNMAKIVSTSLLQEQIDMRSKITRLNTETADLMKDFSEIQTQYYQLCTPNIDNVSSNTSKKETAPAAPSTYLRSSVWGVLFAMILYISILFFVYITNKRLQYTDDPADLYQIPALGHIPADHRHRNFLDHIDHWLRVQRDKGRCLISAKQAIPLSAAAIHVTAHKKGFRHIDGISCRPISKNTAKIEDEIRYILNKYDIGFQTTDNILYNADSLEQLCTMQAAVLIEKAGSVYYKELQQVLRALQQQDVCVIGMIIIE